MFFRLMYRKTATSALSIETIAVHSFDELFSVARSRASNDVSSLCTILPLEKMESIASVFSIPGHETVLSR